MYTSSFSKWYFERRSFASGIGPNRCVTSVLVECKGTMPRHPLPCVSPTITKYPADASGDEFDFVHCASLPRIASSYECPIPITAVRDPSRGSALRLFARV